jgi:hypothetical protein
MYVLVSFGFYILISKTEKDLWVNEKQKKCFNGINVCWLTKAFFWFLVNTPVLFLKGTAV